MSLLLPAVRLCLKVALVGFVSPSMMASDPLQIETRPFQMATKENLDFLFRLITHEDGQPVRNQNGDPLYEGLQYDPQAKLPVSVVLSSKGLSVLDQLKTSQPYREDYPWIPRIGDLEISYSTLEALFNYWSNKPLEFESLFNGTSLSKAKLFRGLLFDRHIYIDSQSLRDLSTSAAEPLPPAVRFTLEIGAEVLMTRFFGWAAPIFGVHFFDDIYVAGLHLIMDKKEIVLDPITQSVKVRMKISQAILQGMVHDVGRQKRLSRVVSPYRKTSDGFRANPEFFSKEELLFGAVLENLTVDISIGMRRDPRGFWQLFQTVPLRLSFDDSPQVKIYRNGRRGDISDEDVENGKILSPMFLIPTKTLEIAPEKIKQIEYFLSEPIDRAFRSVFLAEVFGSRWPLDSKTGARGLIRTRLSDFKFLENSVRITMDGQIRLHHRDPCVASLSVSPESVSQSLSESQRRDSQKLSDQWQISWSPASRWTWRPSDFFDEKRSGSWTLEGYDERPWVRGAITQAGFDFVALVASLSGWICRSSKDLPRPNEISSYLEVSPSELPQLKLGFNTIEARLFADLKVRERNYAFLSEEFDQSPRLWANRSSLRLSTIFPITLRQPFKAKVRWRSDLKVEGWSAEDESAFSSLLASFLPFVQAHGAIKTDGLLPHGPAQWFHEWDIAKGLRSWFSTLSFGEGQPKIHLEDLTISDKAAELTVGFDSLFVLDDNEKDSGSDSAEDKGTRPDSAQGAGPRTGSPQGEAPRPEVGGESRGEVSATDEPYQNARVLQTVIESGPERVHQNSSVVFKFASKNANENLYFSWRLKSPKGLSRWTPFSSHKEAVYSISDAGSYEFQVKAMNALYEIEEVPKTWIFSYEPLTVSDGIVESAIEEKLRERDVSSNNPQGPSKVGEPSSATGEIGMPSSASADSQPEPSKGAFGCHIGPGAQPRVGYSLFIFGLLAVMTLTLRQRSGAPRNPEMPQPCRRSPS